MHPGFCEIGECQVVAAALYATFDGKTVKTCLRCEQDLVSFGWTRIGEEAKAMGGAA